VRRGAPRRLANGLYSAKAQVAFFLTVFLIIVPGSDSLRGGAMVEAVVHWLGNSRGNCSDHIKATLGHIFGPVMKRFSIGETGAIGFGCGKCDLFSRASSVFLEAKD